MDAETIKFITEQNRGLKNDLKDIINLNGSAIRATMESEVDRIDEMDKRRNGKISENRADIYELRKETRISRFAQRNAGKVIIGFIIIVAVISVAAHTVNVKRTIEKVMRIELNE